MAELSEPRCTEVVVSYSGGGKIAINDYGKRVSSWNIFQSQKWELPPDWTEERVDEFQKAEYDKLHDRVDELDQIEHDLRWENREWDD